MYRQRTTYKKELISATAPTPRCSCGTRRQIADIETDQQKRTDGTNYFAVTTRFVREPRPALDFVSEKDDARQGSEMRNVNKPIRQLTSQ